MKQLLLLVGCLLVGSSNLIAAAEGSRMNVLFIISDDLRTEMGCYGSTLAKTPNLDKLASEGVRFEHAYCQFPLCNPSRSSLLTGRQPGTTGVIGNRTWFGAKHPDFISLPKYFKEHGYVTLRSGKIFHGGIDDTEAWSEGGEERRFGAGATARATPSASSPRRELPQDPTNVRIVRGAQPGSPPLTKAQRSDRWIMLQGDGRRTGDNRVADRAIDLLRNHKDDLFFIGCGFSKPHSPPTAPKRFFDLWNVDDIPLPPDFAPRPTVPKGFPAGSIRPKNADLFIRRDASPQEAREMIRAYLASSAWMDWNVGRVLAELDTLGLREKTIVVFWSDHGYQLGEKGKWSKAGSLWEQTIRVPLLIVDPRAKGNGRACPRVVESVDIYPTLVDLCGLPQPDGLEGRSLEPLLENPTVPWNHPAFTVWSEDGKYFTGVSVRTERWHYAEYFGRGAGAMLLDAQNDPAETNNLANDPKYAEVVSRFSSKVRKYAAGHLPPGSEAK